MPVSERLADRGRRRGRQINRTIGQEILSARRMAGISQRSLATAVRLSRAEIGRIERDQAPWLTVIHASALLSVVGLDISAKTYPAGPPLRDAGHLRLLGEFEARLPADIGRIREWVLPNPGGLAAIDLLLTRLPKRTAVEAETVLEDLQALERDVRRKQRDAGLERIFLLVRGSRRNREILRHADALRRAFPLGTRGVLTALSKGADPGADGIVILRRHRPLAPRANSPTRSQLLRIWLAPRAAGAGNPLSRAAAWFVRELARPTSR